MEVSGQILYDRLAEPTILGHKKPTHRESRGTVGNHRQACGTMGNPEEQLDRMGVGMCYCNEPIDYRTSLGFSFSHVTHKI